MARAEDERYSFRMRRNLAQVLAELLQLPLHVRARLAESLIASLDDEAEIEQAWRAEVARRVAALDAGSARTRPLAEVMHELRSGDQHE
jgi:putative addiction module component (TIGR02574 family)